jgi:REP element-mobilizing transposase RayT
MSTRGGKRPGAGRPKLAFSPGGPHRVRPSLSPTHPVHVVLRTTSRTRALRTGRLYRAIRRVLTRYLGRDDFHIVHISIQRTHLHLLVEARDRRALTHGMQSFAINAARAIHRCHATKGKVFAGRYHATPITSPRQARNTLAYVLNNWRRHREDRANAGPIDLYSSAIAFAGWSPRIRRRDVPPSYTPLPVSPPTTKLLRFDWQLFGLLTTLEVPGAIDSGSLRTIGVKRS